MLAEPIENHAVYVEEMLDRDGGVIYQPKLNGARAVATREGIYSRAGKRWCDWLHAEMEPLFRDNPDLVLDGELWEEDCGMDLDMVLSRLKGGSKQSIRFYAFDIINNDPQYTRIKQLSDMAESGEISQLKDDNHPVVYAGGCVVNSLPEFLEFCIAGIKFNWAEGGIMRFLNAPYKHGRSRDLLKAKFWQSDEFLVTDVRREAESKPKAIQVAAFGDLHWCPVAGSASYWRDQGPVLVGKLASVRYLSFEQVKMVSPVVESIRNYE